MRRTEEEARRLRASLIEHAERLVARDGAAALTMRALAAEAGCAVGLPYKVFADRNELVSGLVDRAFRRLLQQFDGWVAGAGCGTVGGNLGRYARLLLESPAVALAHGIEHDPETTRAVDAKAEETGVVTALETAVARYLAAEKRLGRVDAAVDEHAFAFLIAGAIHNLLASGPVYPRPRTEELETILEAVASRMVPRLQEEVPDATTD